MEGSVLFVLFGQLELTKCLQQDSACQRVVHCQLLAEVWVY